MMTAVFGRFQFPLIFARATSGFESSFKNEYFQLFSEFNEAFRVEAEQKNFLHKVVYTVLQTELLVHKA